MYIAKSKTLPLQSFEPKTSSTESRCLNRYASSVVVISNKATVCVLLYLQDVLRGTRRATRAGHDVAGMDLLGHLDSQGQDSEVLPGPVALTWTSLWYALAVSLKQQTSSGAGLQPC